MVVESDDKRIVTLALSSTTKYYKATGGSAKTTDLQPGDHMNIDATKDDNGLLSCEKRHAGEAGYGGGARRGVAAGGRFADCRSRCWWRRYMWTAMTTGLVCAAVRRARTALESGQYCEGGPRTTARGAQRAGSAGGSRS